MTNHFSFTESLKALEAYRIGPSQFLTQGEPGHEGFNRTRSLTSAIIAFANSNRLVTTLVTHIRRVRHSETHEQVENCDALQTSLQHLLLYDLRIN